MNVTASKTSRRPFSSVSLPVQLDRYTELARGLKRPVSALRPSLMLGGAFLAGLPVEAFAQCHPTIPCDTLIIIGTFTVTFDGGDPELALYLGSNFIDLRSFRTGANIGLKGYPDGLGLFVSKLPYGATIDDPMATPSSRGLLTTISGAFGPWLDDPTPGYVGVRFDDTNGQPHYGWIELEVTDANPGPVQVIIVNFAYEPRAGVPIRAGVTTALPIELVTFTAVAADRTIELIWQTALETDNAGFEVERRRPEVVWEPLGFVEGSGTTSEARSYRFTDATVRVGQRYQYRLKQIDFDGSFAYSSRVEAMIASYRLEVGAFYPNPAVRGGRSVLEVSVPEVGVGRVSVFDVHGRVVRERVQEWRVGVQRLEVGMSGLSSGAYFVKVEGPGDEVVYRRLVVR